jgi:hypothetical protein
VATNVGLLFLLKNNFQLFIYLFIIVWDDMSYQYRIFGGEIIVDYAIKFSYQIID